jgi:GT2 family glycosyltransferase
MIKPRNKTKNTTVGVTKATPTPLRSPINKRLHPSDPPIRLLDTKNRLIAAIKLDLAIFSDDELRLNGWCLGSSQLSLLCDEFEVPAKINRYSRQDVLDTNSTTSDFDPGFELTVKNPSRGAYSLRWYLTINGDTNLVDFPLEIELPEAAESGSSMGKKTKSIQASSVAEKSPDNKIKYHIECALPIADGLALIGWVDDRFGNIPTIYVSFPDGTKTVYPFKDKSRRVRLIRTLRPDANNASAANEHGNALLGFVAWLPIEAKPATKVTLAFDEGFVSEQSVLITRMDSDNSALAALQVHSGFALRSIAEQLKDTAIAARLDDIDAELFALHGGGQIAAIDQALTLNSKAILINGWIAADLDDIQQIEVVAGETSVNIKSRLVRMVRPDLIDAFPGLKSHSLGFLALIDDPALLGFSTLKLRVQTRISSRQLIQFTPVVADWPVLLTYMNAHHDLAEPIAKLIVTSPVMQNLPNFSERMATLLRANFLSRYKSLPTAVDNPATTLAAIDRVFALGDAGMLIFGWHYEPKTKPQTITIRGPEGQTCDVTESLFPLARLDVSENYKKRFPDITDLCGFVCFAPIPTQPGESRAMQFSFRGSNDVWIKLASTAIEAQGLQLIKEILGIIPAPDKIRGSLYALFDRALGSAIEAISTTSRKTVAEISERQFGIPPAAPSVSVIVPLFGRYDFLRHQLAHFVDDPDFDNVDLIYVVDDPAIIVPALDMAAAHHQLFNKPFRVVWYGQNLGFAGANNIGARVARADTLLLLNSDVIPQANGWLAALHTALNELPDAGAVGPLLQFADNSVQHAGMLPKRDPFFPGFLLNIHPGKGINWNKGNEPSQHPLLTAACLMLRKSDYLAAGGLDEGYIIGDFEDSDLCLKLRKCGQTLWLVPAARLWHLERQSQNLENIAGYRQLLTLFNGWRYHQKINNGEIANPEQSGA